MQSVDADVVFLPNDGEVADSRSDVIQVWEAEAEPTLRSYADIWMPVYPWGDNAEVILGYHASSAKGLMIGGLTCRYQFAWFQDVTERNRVAGFEPKMEVSEADGRALLDRFNIPIPDDQPRIETFAMRSTIVGKTPRGNIVFLHSLTMHGVRFCNVLPQCGTDWNIEQPNPVYSIITLEMLCHVCGLNLELNLEGLLIYVTSAGIHSSRVSQHLFGLLELDANAIGAVMRICREGNAPWNLTRVWRFTYGDFRFILSPTRESAPAFLF